MPLASPASALAVSRNDFIGTNLLWASRLSLPDDRATSTRRVDTDWIAQRVIEREWGA